MSIQTHINDIQIEICNAHIIKHLTCCYDWCIDKNNNNSCSLFIQHITRHKELMFIFGFRFINGMVEKVASKKILYYLRLIHKKYMYVLIKNLF